MGDAKRRGTYEQRKALAIQREKEEAEIRRNNQPPRAHRTHVQADILAAILESSMYARMLRK
jgi:hypothetical protein